MSYTFEDFFDDKLAPNLKDIIEEKNNHPLTHRATRRQQIRCGTIYVRQWYTHKYHASIQGPHHRTSWQYHTQHDRAGADIRKPCSRNPRNVDQRQCTHSHKRNGGARK